MPSTDNRYFIGISKFKAESEIKGNTKLISAFDVNKIL